MYRLKQATLPWLNANLLSLIPALVNFKDLAATVGILPGMAHTKNVGQAATIKTLHTTTAALKAAGVITMNAMAPLAITGTPAIPKTMVAQTAQNLFGRYLIAPVPPFLATKRQALHMELSLLANKH